MSDFPWSEIRALRLDDPRWWSTLPRLRPLAVEAAERAEELGLQGSPELDHYLIDEDRFIRAWLRRVQGALRERGGVGK
jgi:hypothetical protein